MTEPSTASAELPELRLELTALEHNVRLMTDWCAERSVELCPHVKTTMTEPIVRRQLDAGAWGVTVATARQAAIALDWGPHRVLIANEVIHGPDLVRLRHFLDADPSLEVYCLVDSAAGVELARSAMDGGRNPLRVLVDVGAVGGRTGVRDAAEAAELGRTVADSPGLVLAGVAGYEGIRPNRRDAETLAAVDAHCRTTVDAFHRLAPSFAVDTPVFTMGGSAFPDRVIAVLPELRAHPTGRDAVTVLRSGCYVTHDHGTYQDVTPIPGLRPALSVRAVVLSTPEPGRAVVGAGKRELPYDAGLPVLLTAHAPDAQLRPSAAATASQIFDHHLILTDTRDLHVGDIVDLGISHPCSAFDRWPTITVTTNGRPVDTWHPRFT